MYKTKKIEQRHHARYQMINQHHAAIETNKMRVMGHIYDASARGFSIKAKNSTAPRDSVKEEPCFIEFMSGGKLIKYTGKIIRMQNDLVCVNTDQVVSEEVLAHICDGSGAVKLDHQEAYIFGAMTPAVAQSLVEAVKQGYSVHLNNASGDTDTTVRLAKLSIDRHGLVKGCPPEVKAHMQATNYCSKCHGCPKPVPAALARMDAALAVFRQKLQAVSKN